MIRWRNRWLMDGGSGRQLDGKIGGVMEDGWTVER